MPADGKSVKTTAPSSVLYGEGAVLLCIFFQAALPYSKAPARGVLYSLRSATTGSFLAALREGIRPEISVSRTLMPTRMTAAGSGSTA